MKGVLSLFSGCLIFANVCLTLAAPIDDLVAAAKKEGVIELLAPSTSARSFGTGFSQN